MHTIINDIISSKEAILELFNDDLVVSEEASGALLTIGYDINNIYYTNKLLSGFLDHMTEPYDDILSISQVKFTDVNILDGYHWSLPEDFPIERYYIPSGDLTDIMKATLIGNKITLDPIGMFNDVPDVINESWIVVDIWTSDTNPTSTELRTYYSYSNNYRPLVI